ncbi:MAG: glycosyltransferase family 39 protein, partial [Lachnospiraceae bacterium]|nr:glycosyltransferase family 39 protein [Lachnospiraceae bacterium]
MNWKRAKISYLPLIILAIVSGVMTYYASQEFATRHGIGGNLIWAIFAGVLLLGGLFSVLSYFVKSKLPTIKDHPWIFGVSEALFFFGILTAGTMMRFGMVNSFEVNQLYEIATIKYQMPFPSGFHGAEELYLRCLRQLCFILGNTPYFCIRFHLLLTSVAVIPWYLGIRKMTGRIPAITFLGFYCLSPFMMTWSAHFTAEPLAFLALGVALWFISAFLKEGEKYWVICILAGIAAGIGCYFDAMGILLLCLGFFFYGKKTDGAKNVAPQEEGAFTEEEKKRLIRLTAFYACAVVGFLGCILAKSLLLGGSFGDVISGWSSQYSPVGLVDFELDGFMKSWFSGYLGVEVSLAVGALIITAIFSFFVTYEQPKTHPWSVLLVLAVLYMMLGFPTKAVEIPFDGSLFVIACLFVLAGIGVQTLLVPGMKKVEEEAKEEVKAEVKAEAKEVAKVEEKAEEKKEAEARDRAEEKEETKADFATVVEGKVEELKVEEIEIEEIKFEDLLKPEEDKKEKVVDVLKEEPKPEVEAKAEVNVKAETKVEASAESEAEVKADIQRTTENAREEKPQKKADKLSLKMRIKKIRDDQREIVKYAMEHPETLEGKNIIVRMLYERAFENVRRREDSEKVLRT